MLPRPRPSCCTYWGEPGLAVADSCRLCAIRESRSAEGARTSPFPQSSTKSVRGKARGDPTELDQCVESPAEADVRQLDDGELGYLGADSASSEFASFPAVPSA